MTYMLALEGEPETYEAGFTALTGGVNLEVRRWVASKLDGRGRVLEVGCGPGTLSVDLARAGCQVVAVDASPAMVRQAKKKVASEGLADSVEVAVGNATDLPGGEGSFDAVVSMFLLSELRPFEQLAFLRQAWNKLRPGGRLLVAAEFVPRGPRRVGFALRRWWYARKLRRLRSGLTHPLKWFDRYPPALGFRQVDLRSWRGGAIKALEYEKVESDGGAGGSPGLYLPPPKPFTGPKARLVAARCLLTGQVDHVAVEPGVYPSGNPDRTSPVVVTANYAYTHFRVMRALRGVDAWVLLVDSRGVNVWCAARGGNFGNHQLKEALLHSGVSELVDHRKLVLPQLAAGGVSFRELAQDPDFGWRPTYGPVWAEDLPEYLARGSPAKKPQEWRVAKFDAGKRLQAGVTHATFLLRKLALRPTAAIALALVLVAAVRPGTASAPWWPAAWRLAGAAWASLTCVALFVALAFPAVGFTRKFVAKGATFAAVCAAATAPLAAWRTLDDPLTFLGPPNPLQVAGEVLLVAWVAFFVTMSFSGYTFETSPREIVAEYDGFVRINRALAALSTTLYAAGVVLNVVT
ncbi:MAG: hypothetical protein Kow0069_08900 [Promethearchaeota archaeon]